MAAARRAGPPIVTGKFSIAESESDACEDSGCAGGCGAGADMGSDSAGGGIRLGSIPVISAGRGALGCGASAAGVDAGAGIGAGPADDVVVARVGAESGDTVIGAGASDAACSAGDGDNGPSRFGATGAAAPESRGLFNDASGAASDSAAGAGIEACSVEGATALELVSGCAGNGNGWSVTAGAPTETRSP